MGSAEEAREIAALKEQLEQLKVMNDELRAAQELVPPPERPEANPELESLKSQVQQMMKEFNETRAQASVSRSAGGASEFVPPLSNALGTSSLRSLFPDVEEAHITAITNHSFPGDDLFKLDSRFRDKEPTFMLNPLTGQFEKSTTTAKCYKDYDSLYLPLVTYFSILSVHMKNQRTVPFHFFSFLIHLQKLERHYEWQAVLEYTMKFFNRRRLEMLEDGNYSGWGLPDSHLMAEHVNAYRKASPKAATSQKSSVSRTPVVCNNWNANKCTTNGAKCPSGRSHVCSTCGKADHTTLTHSSA